MTADRQALAQKVIAEARSWVGTKMIPGGDCKGVGADCLFYRHPYHACGLCPDIDVGARPSGRFLRDDRYLRLMAPYVVPREGRPQPADIALFEVALAPNHAAIVIDWPTVIHAQPEGCIAEENIFRTIFAERLHSVWTPKGLADMAGGA